MENSLALRVRRRKMVPQGHNKRPALALGQGVLAIGDSVAVPRSKKNPTACQPCKQTKRKVGSIVHSRDKLLLLAETLRNMLNPSLKKSFVYLSISLTFSLASSSAVDRHHLVKLAEVAILNVFSTRVWTLDAKWLSDEPLTNSRIPAVIIETYCILC